MKLKDYLNEVIKFLQDYLKKAHSSGYVLGLSGGIDSALVLALLIRAIKKENIHILLLPIDSDSKDGKYAIKQCEAFNVSYEIIDLSSSYHHIVDEIEKVHPLTDLSKSNIKVRLRMVTLYAVGQAENSLVVGTDNLDERYVGYFTKYGDGAADLLPIAKLTKGEIYEASKILGVIPEIINRPPSAGLFEGQTDEKDLGVPYKVLDSYLLGNKIEPEFEQRINFLHKISHHKRNKIVEAKKFKR